MKRMPMLLLTLLLMACGSGSVEYRVVTATPRPTHEATPVLKIGEPLFQSQVISTKMIASNTHKQPDEDYLFLPMARHIRVAGWELCFSITTDCP